ncbi:MAG TPA: hypothetical protein VJZ26_05630 [Blastocatellia bacterium]|nr:hypothetical protein [Blastocatellia bacterium]
MRIKCFASMIVLFVILIACPINAQQTRESNHPQHPSGVNDRGDHAMGFSHDKTTHHFKLTANGGAVEVSANDPKDTGSRDRIRMHLSHIAELFKEGDFSKPMFIHDKTPPGVPVMIQLKTEINYTFQETEQGARVRITTANAKALAAIHEFLRFQIKDHETGDSLEVTPDN